MRSETVDRLLKAMTKEVKTFVDDYADLLIKQTKPMTTKNKAPPVFGVNLYRLYA